MRLFYFVFAIFDVLLCDRIVFLLLHLIRLRARILPGHIVVTSARAGDQLDLESDGFGYGIPLLSDVRRCLWRGN